MGGPGFTANFPRPSASFMDEEWMINEFHPLSSMIIRCHMLSSNHIQSTNVHSTSSFAQVRCGGARMLLGSLAASDRAASHAEGCLAPRCQGHRCQAPGADVTKDNKGGKVVQ